MLIAKHKGIICQCLFLKLRNSEYPDQRASEELPHLGLHCLQIYPNEY